MLKQIINAKILTPQGWLKDLSIDNLLQHSIL